MKLLSRHNARKNNSILLPENYTKTTKNRNRNPITSAQLLQDCLRVKLTNSLSAL